MWIELGIPKLPDVSQNRVWINTDNIVRIEFTKEGSINQAKVITVKPGGSDTTLFLGDDADRIREAMEKLREKI